MARHTGSHARDCQGSHFTAAAGCSSASGGSAFKRRVRTNPCRPHPITISAGVISWLSTRFNTRSPLIWKSLKIYVIHVAFYHLMYIGKDRWTSSPGAVTWGRWNFRCVLYSFCFTIWYATIKMSTEKQKGHLFFTILSTLKHPGSDGRGKYEILPVYGFRHMYQANGSDK